MVPWLIGGAAAYGLVVGGLYLLQDQILFPRHAARTPLWPLPGHAERLRLVSADGDRLFGVLIRATGAGRGLVIGFPGNAWNAEDYATFLAQRLFDFDVAVFHYRGYHPSEGTPGERQLFDDARLVHDTLVRGLRPERVYAVGASLGSGVAAHLAAHRRLDGLVLLTPFDSVYAIAKSRYPYVPVSWLLRHPFRSDLHLAGRDVPVAVIAASDDSVVPAERTQALVRVLKRPVLHEVVEGTHSGLYDNPRFDAVLRRAMDALERTREPLAEGRVSVDADGVGAGAP